MVGFTSTNRVTVNVSVRLKWVGFVFRLVSVSSPPVKVCIHSHEMTFSHVLTTTAVFSTMQWMQVNTALNSMYCAYSAFNTVLAISTVSSCIVISLTVINLLQHQSPQRQDLLQLQTPQRQEYPKPTGTTLKRHLQTCYRFNTCIFIHHFESSYLKIFGTVVNTFQFISTVSHCK